MSVPFFPSSLPFRLPFSSQVLNDPSSCSFQLFMVGLFTLDGAWKTSAATLPLVAITIFWTWRTFKTFEPLCDNVSLTLIADVQRGEGAESVMRTAGEPEGDSGVTRSQTLVLRTSRETGRAEDETDELGSVALTLSQEPESTTIRCKPRGSVPCSR